MMWTYKIYIAINKKEIFNLRKEGRKKEGQHYKRDIKQKRENYKKTIKLM